MSNSRFGKSVLIVEQKLEELTRLRDIVSSLGFERAEAASSVNMAVSFLRENSFDLVLVAYSLGSDEKNGLQLIQESFNEGLGLFQTLFMLVVEPEASSLLVGSLESAPDAYISKPFDRAKIQSRLEKLLRVKKVVYRVEEAMDAQQWESAIQYCDKIADVYPGLKVYLGRLKGICLLESRQYKEAQLLFGELVTVRNQVWAQVGLGMSHHFLGQHKEAVHVLQQVIDQQHISVEAFSWLARSLQALGEDSEAVMSMRKAVMLQATVPQLQADLGHLAASADEWNLAVDAFRATLKYSRYTVFQNPDHYFSFVRALIERYLIKKGPPEELELESIRVLEDAVRDSGDDTTVKFRSHV